MAYIQSCTWKCKWKTYQVILKIIIKYDDRQWNIFSKNLNIKIYSLHQQQNKHSNKIKKNDMYTYGHTDCWPIPFLSIQSSLHPTLFLLLLKRELPDKFFNTVMLKIETTEINCYWNGEKSHGQSPVQN